MIIGFDGVIMFITQNCRLNDLFVDSAHHFCTCIFHEQNLLVILVSQHRYIGAAGPYLIWNMVHAVGISLEHEWVVLIAISTAHPFFVEPHYLFHKHFSLFNYFLVL